MERRTFFATITAALVAMMRPIAALVQRPAYAPVPEDLSSIVNTCDFAGPSRFRLARVMAKYTVPGDSEVYFGEWAGVASLDDDSLRAAKVLNLERAMRVTLEESHGPGWLTTKHKGTLQTIAVSSMEWQRV